MSDDITVSGGGSVVVTSDAILARIERLGSLAPELRANAAEVLAIAADNRFAELMAPQVGASLAQARRALEDAHQQLLAAGQLSSALSCALRQTLESCGAVEDFGRRLAERASADAAWWAGRATALVALPVLASLTLDELVALAASGSTPKQQEAALAKFLAEHDGILSNPGTVLGVRAGVENVAPFAEGFLGLPPELGRLFEGVTGRQALPLTAATVLLLARAAGWLHESEVSVRRTGTVTHAAPPTSLTDRVDRIPDPLSGSGGEQIRIERYSAHDKPDRFEVYIAGTVDFNPKTAGEPFDMTSNVAGVAQQSPASYRAVVEAMKAAGVTSTTPVQVTGYSQGGLVASLVAASGNYDVKGLITFGAPSGQVPIPTGVPVLHVRHAEDLVPATGGYDVNNQAIVVERSLFDNHPVPDAIAVPAHHIEYYRQTAALIDSARSDELVGAVRKIDGFGEGATTVTSSTWIARRVPAD